MSTFGARQRALLRPPSWSPARLGSALLGWWDASQPSTVTIATGVSAWASRTPSVVTLSQSTGASQPSYATSGITFSGVNVRLDIANWPSVWDMLIVGVPSATTSIFRSIVSSGSEEHALLNQNTNNLGYYTNSFQASGLSWAPSTQGIMYCSMPSAKTPTFSRDGGAVSAAGAALTTSASTRLGGISGASNEGFGTINEVILGNRALTTGERQQVEGYLGWKWGLQTFLPTNHPYRFRRP